MNTQYSKNPVRSLVDIDVYKLYMLVFILAYFPEMGTVWRFSNRGKHAFPAGSADRIMKYVREVANYRFTPADVDKMLSLPNLDHATRMRLRQTLLDFCLNADDITVVQEGGEIFAEAKGSWSQVTLWEIYLMQIISAELNESKGIQLVNDIYLEEAVMKDRIAQELGLVMVDFGARRRFEDRREGWHHYNVLSVMKNTRTSNFQLAQELGRGDAVGTMAHEIYMVLTAKYGPVIATRLVLQLWFLLWGKPLAVALTDTYGSDLFFEIFAEKFGEHTELLSQFVDPEVWEDIAEMTFAELYAGVRHDSGPAIAFGEKYIAMLKSLGFTDAQIAKKKIVFSDGLTSLKFDEQGNPVYLSELIEIANHFKGRIIVLFGVGTSITNDVGRSVNDLESYRPTNIVVKVFLVFWEEDGNICEVFAVKFSDMKEKLMGDKQRAAQIREEVNDFLQRSPIAA